MSLLPPALPGVNDGANLDVFGVDAINHQVGCSRDNELTQMPMARRWRRHFREMLKQRHRGKDTLADAIRSRRALTPQKGDGRVEIASRAVTPDNGHQRGRLRKARTTSSCGVMRSSASSRASIAAHCSALSKSSPASSSIKSIWAAIASCSFSGNERRRAIVLSRLAIFEFYHFTPARASSALGARI